MVMEEQSRKRTAFVVNVSGSTVLGLFVECIVSYSVRTVACMPGSP